MKYVKNESELINIRKERENLLKRVRGAENEREELSKKLKNVMSEKSAISQILELKVCSQLFGYPTVFRVVRSFPILQFSFLFNDRGSRKN